MRVYGIWFANIVISKLITTFSQTIVTEKRFKTEGHLFATPKRFDCLLKLRFNNEIHKDEEEEGGFSNRRVIS